MAGLNIPTTRALSLIVSSEKIVRDPLYNGIMKTENAAVLLRVSPTFLRFGSFHLPAKPNISSQQEKLMEMMRSRRYLASMADFLIQNFYPDIDEEETDIYEEMFRRVVVKSA